MSVVLNPFTGKFDFAGSNPSKFIEITTQAFYDAVEGATLTPMTWYLLTDYQTTSWVRGTAGTTNETFTGDVEEIYIFATSESTYAAEGYSKTYPTEEVTFIHNPPALTQDWYVYYESGEAYASEPESYTSTSIDFSNLISGSYYDSIYIEGYDPDAADFYFDTSGEGTDFTFVNGVLTIISPEFAANLVNCFEAEGGYLNIYFNSVVAEPVGQIIARYNTKTKFYVDVDYRGIKVRRWKPNAPTYSVSTAYTEGQHVTFNGDVYVCIVSNTGSYPYLGTSWTKILRNNSDVFYYSMPSSSLSHSKYSLTATTDYHDVYPFVYTDLYEGTTVVNSSYYGNWQNFNLYQTGTAENAVVNLSSGARVSILSSYSNVNANLSNTCITGLASVANFKMSGGIFYSMIWAQIFSMTQCTISYVQTLSMNNVSYSLFGASTISNNTIGTMSYSYFYGAFSNNKIDYSATCTVTGACTYNEITSIASSTWTLMTTCVLKGSITTSTFGSWTGIFALQSMYTNTWAGQWINCYFYASVYNNTMTNASNQLSSSIFNGYLANNTGAGFLGINTCFFIGYIYQWTCNTGSSTQILNSNFYGNVIFFTFDRQVAISNITCFGSISAWLFNSSIGNPTISIASPAVVTMASHGLVAGDTISFTTTGALPTGITAGTRYYVMTAGFSAGAFQISINGAGGPAVNTSGTQSGTHTLYWETATINNNVFKGISTNLTVNGILRNSEMGDNFNSNTCYGTSEYVTYPANYYSMTITRVSNRNIFSKNYCPATDSTTALKFTQADGTTAVVTIDTTNGHMKVLAGFGCNGASAQTAYASGGAVTTSAGSYGFASDTERANLTALVDNIRTALVNNGIMS